MRQVQTVRPQQPTFRPAQVPAVAAVVLRARLRAQRALAPPEVRQVQVWVGPQAQPELAVLQQARALKELPARQVPALVAAHWAAAAQVGSGSIQPSTTDHYSAR